jgi:molybdenum cofactor cytidylyltransferase
MTACANIAAVLLAAGAGTRFGGNKLEAHFGAAMLGEHAAGTLSAMGFGWTFAVHDPANARLAMALSARGFTLVENTAVGAGLSHSLALAVGAVARTKADVMLIALGDMPFVDIEMLQALVGAHHGYPDRIIASSDGVATTPPAIFPSAFWPVLKASAGDTGARSHLSGAINVIVDAKKLRDIDTIDDVISSSFR